MSNFFPPNENRHPLIVNTEQYNKLRNILPQKKEALKIGEAEMYLITDESIPDGEIHCYPPYQKFKLKIDE